MPRKFHISKKPIKPFDDVHIRTKGQFLYDLSLFWGNKTLGASSAVEVYIQSRKHAASLFEKAFTIEEINILASVNPSFFLNVNDPKRYLVDLLSQSSSPTESCIDKIEGFSQIETIYLMSEIGRLNYIRSYAYDKYTLLSQPLDEL
jgi:hypothetical protein